MLNQNNTFGDQQIAYTVAALVVLGLFASFLTSGVGNLAIAHFANGGELNPSSASIVGAGVAASASAIGGAAGLSATTVTGAGLALTGPAGAAIVGGALLG